MRGDPNREIYRGYDIRGLAGLDLTADLVTRMGRAIAVYVRSRSGDTVYLGFDGRPSGLELVEAVAGGLIAGGVHVVELGVVPTPLVYFASSSHSGSFGVAVTASHLAAEWNGLKLCQGSRPVHTDVIRQLVENVPLTAVPGGTRSHGRAEMLAAYKSMLQEVGSGSRARSDGKSLRVVLDCQNAAASMVAPTLFEELGLDVSAIYTNPSAGYPFETPDPQVPEHLEALSEATRARGAVVGFAFDGDADRLGVVDEHGRRLAPDGVLALLAKDVVGRLPGSAVVYDVLSSPVVEAAVRRAGGRPVEARSGHAFVQELLRDEAASLGGEGSGHIFFADGYRGRSLGYDDAIYAAVRLVELIGRVGPLGASFDALPPVVGGDEWRPYCPDGLKRKIVEEVRRSFLAEGLRVSSVDGVKAHFGPVSWALVRAANTEPALSVRIVGSSTADVSQVESRIRGLVREIAARYDVSL